MICSINPSLKKIRPSLSCKGLEGYAPTGKISVYAGDGQPGKSPDGTPAVNAALGAPYGIAIDAQDNLYIAQEDSETIISKVEAKSGKIYHFAGDGSSWYILSNSWRLE